MKTVFKWMTVTALVLAMALPCWAMSYTQTDAKFGSFGGIVTEVREGDRFSFLQVDSKDTDEVMIFNILSPVLLFSTDTMAPITSKDFKVGDTITAFYPTMTPVAQSYPPQMTPLVVLRHQGDNPMSAKVDVFDKAGLSSDGSLIVSVDDQTKIVDLQGNVLKKSDIENKTIIAFYSIVAMSYPAQTTAVKIIVLPDQTLDTTPGDVQVEEGKPQVIPTPETYVKDGITYVRLADLATALDYELQWDDTTKTVTMKRMNSPVSYLLHIGEKMYGYNKALGYFEHAPLLYQDRTYVEESFVKLLLER